MAEINPEELSKALKSLTDSTGDASKATNARAAAEQKAVETAKIAAAAYKNAATGILGGAKELGNAMTSSAAGLEKYSGAVGSVTNTTYGLLAAMGPLGLAIGGLVKLFGMVATASLKQNDALSKAFDQLSEFGAIDTRGFRGVLDDLKAVGGSSENIQFFLEGLRKVGPELGTFGGTAAVGRKALVDVFQKTLQGDTEYRLRRFGVTMEDAFKFTGNYIKQQTLSGGTLGKTTEQLNQESVRYIGNLSDIARLTGLTRDEMEEAREAQLQDARLQLHLQELRASGAKGEAEANRIQTSLAYVEKVYGKSFGDGMRDMILNNGAITSDKAAAVAMSLGNAGFEGINKVVKGSGDLATDLGNMTNDFGPRLEGNFKRLGPAMKAGAMGAMDELGVSVEAYAGMQRAKTIDVKKFIEEREAIEKEGVNARRDTETAIVKQERNVRNAMEDFKFAIGDKLLPAVLGATSIFHSFAKFLAKMIDKFGTYVGLGKTNLSANFRDLTDNAEDLKVANQELAESNQKAALAQERKAKLDEIAAALTEAGAQGATPREQGAAAQRAIDKLVQDQEKLSVAKEEAWKKETDATKKEQLMKEKLAADEQRAQYWDIANSMRMAGVDRKKEVFDTFMQKQQTVEQEERTKILEREKKILELKEETAKLGGKQDTRDFDNITQSYMEKVAKKESGGQYNTTFGRSGTGDINGKKVTESTIAEVAAWQAEEKRLKTNKQAAGAYQFMDVAGAAKRAGIDMTAKFDKETQDKMMRAYTDENAKVLQSLGVFPNEENLSLAHGVGAAGAAKLIKAQKEGKGADKAADVLGLKEGPERDTNPHLMKPVNTVIADFAKRVAKTAATGGVFEGPSSGYPVMLHGPGKEFVFREDQLRTMVESVQKSTLESQIGSLTTRQGSFGSMMNPSDDIKTMVTMLSQKFDDAIDEIRKGNRIQEKVVTALA
jgi:hypothetical protein